MEESILEEESPWMLEEEMLMKYFIFIQNI